LKVTISASLDFTYKINDVNSVLMGKGFDTFIPETARKIIEGQFIYEDIMKEKKQGRLSNRIIEQNTLITYYNFIKASDCLLVLNYEKNGIANYIGGQVLIEMGFAYILQKPIFILNNIPQMTYMDVIEAMQPITLDGEIYNFILKIRKII
jgi:hypothetical protein